VARFEGYPVTSEEGNPMSATAPLPVTAGTVEDAFDLDVQVIIDAPPDHPLAACQGNTDDGCDPSCASACVTGGV
jgi:FxLD family lantipeptide